MNRRGFTLLEILVAVALIGLVLVAMNTLLFSMGELWGKNSEQRLFELHVRNVSRFLEHEIRRAALPPVLNPEKRVAVREIRTERGSTETLLTYTLANGTRLCNWGDEKPLPDVECALVAREREGLILLWHSRWEREFNDDAPRETVVSPWVVSLQYDYYDEGFKNWKTEREPLRNSGQYEVPQRLRLLFRYSGREIESVINLPTVGEGLPQL